MFQMLEMKLALSVDFPEKMNPGVFVTCADDIVLLEGNVVAYCSVLLWSRVVD